VGLILNIETSTTVCSVALAEHGKLLSLKEENKGFTHSEHITIFIQDVLKQAGKNISELDAVAVSSGPGSYTGLRIGVSTAKGLCYALDKPLISISTLKSLTLALSKGEGMPSHRSIQDSLLCPMLDARRMEVYCAMFDESLNEILPVQPKVIDENSFSDLLKTNKIYFFGDGAEKCKTILAHQPNAVFIDDIFPSATTMISLSEEKFAKKEFENVALFEPFYLKEFFDTKKNAAAK
jgi:tRNA threonylcarbamoyladenosine biosynthesis protein TsaB